jgi:DNA polymerase III alpha subunit (gram-positive type)
MGSNFPHIMIDLETSGLQPDHAHILQIAAVRFNLHERTVDPNVFDMCLFPSPNRFWEQDTADWWSQQKPEILTSIYARMKDPKTVLIAFRNWVLEGGSDPILWAKPLSFEWPFIQSYFREYEVTNPFFFRNANDMNSWIRARHFPDLPPPYEKEIEFEGDAHNAIYDCFHQIKALFACMEATSG